MKIENDQITEFKKYLISEERSEGTIEKYLRDVRKFAEWLETQDLFFSLSKEAAAAWKQSLLEKHYKPVTVNSMIAALKTFLRCINRTECMVRFMKIQRRTFRKETRELTKEDYMKLLKTAEKTGRIRLALLMETICSTGIRVSEVKYVTVEAARAKRAEVFMKGKIRIILFSSRLCRKLLKYAARRGIRTGTIFVTSAGRPIGRKQIWAEMKTLCKAAEVNEERVFPHNLRHLFAKTFYRSCRDLSKLADLLGHSSIDTTRIYLQTTEQEQVRALEHLGLVV